ncbi:MAG TPA: hypothetical protein VNG12_18400 [Acidimicrobiales bacterium]|nr:hypothetical protein [Acidimicrobiales bacterium]
MGAPLYTRASAAATTGGTSGPLNMGASTALAVGVTVSAASGTSPKLTLLVEWQGSDGAWYQLWKATQVTAAGATVTTIGAGCATAEAVPGTIRLRWAVSGTTPSFTFSASVLAI